MNTRVFRGDVSGAAELIAAGGLVAVPTETVYGLAGDGTDVQAVERIYEVQPDMVLLDLNMPEKDGIAVIREARLDRMIPVIIITGHYSELLMNRADIPCVYGCLMKPTSEAQVQAAMRRTK